MWSNIEEAVKQYAARRKYIYAEDYSLPWRPVVLGEAQKYLAHTFNEKITSVQVNTPSVGQYWPTHPTYRYINKEVVFIKCSDINQIKKEFNNLHEMKRDSISVPTPLGIYEVSEGTWSDEKSMLCQKGAILVEEFLYSISLGHALVDERINLDELINMVLDELYWLHHFGIHGDMKHQHIRVCLRSGLAEKLIFEEPKTGDPEIKIGRVCIIDAEDYKEKQDKEHYMKDLDILCKTTKNYLLRLEGEDILARKVTIIPPEERKARFRKLLNAINLKYNLKKPFELTEIKSWKQSLRNGARRRGKSK